MLRFSRVLTLISPSTAFSAVPVTRSQREGNSPFSSLERPSSKMISSPGTKLYLLHIFAVPDTVVSEVSPGSAVGWDVGEEASAGLAEVPSSFRTPSIALLVSLVTFSSVFFKTALSAAFSAFLAIFENTWASAGREPIRKPAIRRNSTFFISKDLKYYNGGMVTNGGRKALSQNSFNQIYKII